MDETGSITEREEHFERAKKRIGLYLGPAVFLALYFYPFGLAPRAHSILAIMGLVLIYWLTEALPLPISALIGTLLAALMGVANAKEVFTPFANPLIFLFIGSFILAEAITEHKLDRRFAFAVFSIRAISKSPAGLLAGVGAISAFVSMWISNTAATAMLLPIAIGVLSPFAKSRDEWSRRYSTAVLLMVAYGASVGGIATPIGTPPNIIGIGMLQELSGVHISFLEWMAFAMPITAVMFVFLIVILGPFGKTGRWPKDMAQSGLLVEKRPGKWSRGEKNTALCFAITVFLWLLPSLSELIAGKESIIAQTLGERLNEGICALIGACLLFVLPISTSTREFTMSWQRAVRIDWGTIILFGGGLSLGGLVFSTGLAADIGSVLSGATGANTLWSITALGTALAIVLSETTSNTAAANMVIPIVIALAHGAGVSPVAPALGTCLGSSFGFMLPVSTPPNAIVFGTGLVPMTSMIKKGVVFDICGFFLIMGGLYVLCPLFGWV